MEIIRMGNEKQDGEEYCYWTKGRLDMVAQTHYLIGGGTVEVIHCYPEDDIDWIEEYFQSNYPDIKIEVVADLE